MNKSLTHTLTLALAATLAMASAQAQPDFPNKAVKLVVPFAPGGSSDSSARILAEQLSVKWKQPVIIENKPGANGSLAASFVAKSPANGYTILYTPVSIGTIKLFVKSPGFDPLKDLTPVTQVARGDYVLNVQKDLPVNTIGEFADYARNNAGKVFHGSFGGASQMAFEQLAGMLKFKAIDVPYRGEAPAFAALIGGETHAMFSTLTTARPFIEAGRVKALGLASKSRSPLAPDIKSADESGAKGFHVDFWFGLTVPAGTPPEVVQKLNADVNEVLARAEVKERFLGMGLSAAPTSPQEFGKIIKYESERWVDTARRIGLQPQ
ncbi:tripartite tricarboxylate transporter substrate binding protein [Xenophilus arseniciresistens]|uniref:Tripartite tricarboxylate transporter substrate binding protein n=1 Tax=Xenophilus arseniciresistens TaxID=1283306 RepID=A0AAE3N801_9BURK|nr:tripartite tricarboxylate transporter substrate binding protein [Xenophilus arseniciresistens]MDA7417720.1 tripartite tricarboxylate transporter substrate binding protein [Xenophilus arseniciresistens]